MREVSGLIQKHMWLSEVLKYYDEHLKDYLTAQDLVKIGLYRNYLQTHFAKKRGEPPLPVLETDPHKSHKGPRFFYLKKDVMLKIKRMLEGAWG